MFVSLPAGSLVCWVVYANLVVKWASLGTPGGATKLPESRAQRGGVNHGL